MKKNLCIFLLAVLLPALGLGWLALRNAEEQRIILEKRTAELYQKETVAVADAVRSVIENERRAFLEVVSKLLAQEDSAKLAAEFSTKLSTNWSRKAVGFTLNKEGTVLSPTLANAKRNETWNRFLGMNAAFLSGNAQVTVYPVPQDELLSTDNIRRSKALTENNAINTRQMVPKSNASIAAEKDQKLPTSVAPKPVLPIEKQSRSKESDLASVSKKPFNSTSKATPAPLADSKKKLELAIQAPASPSGDASLRGLSDATVHAPAPAESKRELPASAPAAPKMELEGKLELSVQPIPPAPIGADDHRAPEAPATATFSNAPAATPSEFKLDFKEAENRQVAIVNNAQDQGQTIRMVAPSWGITNNSPQVSQIVTATADFRALTASGTEGVISRFVQDRLEVIFWQRPPGAGDLIFGCLIEADAFKDLWSATLPTQSSSGRLSRSSSDSVFGNQSEFVLALLDEKARPVAIQPPSETGRDWKRPFVASEIGEVLPHWEAALYLMHPQQLEKSATALRRNVTLLIAAALLAIAAGGWAVMADARRQVALAQKKTDFVSNVSHELKTPLTSIRMFAELMHDGHGASAEKHPQYLRIIMLEAERLTRLINNVLDFARMERRQKQYDKRPLDLHAVLTRIWEAQEMHLRQNGFTTRWQAAPPPYPVLADEDALAQVLVNLLSNAEKYSGDRKEVELHSYLDSGHVCVSVLDRGLGVPAGEEKKIFEAFYRAHDSLSSGIQGSGLGLTLALRLVAEHQGEILYQPRADGGSNFTLRLPLAAQPAETCA